MKKYIKRVKEQLCCNATKEYSNNFITYKYTNKQVDENLNYFKRCKDVNLSPYKALLYFGEYLRGNFDELKPKS